MCEINELFLSPAEPRKVLQIMSFGPEWTAGMSAAVSPVHLHSLSHFTVPGLLSHYACNHHNVFQFSLENPKPFLLFLLTVNSKEMWRVVLCPSAVYHHSINWPLIWSEKLPVKNTIFYHYFLGMTVFSF